ncbi:unnamed protein product, partial [Rotaria sordida]
NLQIYPGLYRQYQEEYGRMKDYLNEYKSVKEILLKKKREEKAQIENELAQLNTNLKENRKKLSRFKDEKLTLLKEEAILTEDILQKTEEEIQYEHEYEINYILDKEIESPRIRKTFLNKIEEDAFLPFVQKLTNSDQNNGNLLVFRVLSASISGKEDDQLVERSVCWLINFDPTKIDFQEITKIIKQFFQGDETVLCQFENSHKSAKIEQFDPYSIFIESLKAMINILKNIFQTKLSDMKFNLKQIERFYRGIHYSYEIDMNQIIQSIQNMKIDNGDLELNIIFVNFLKQIELITIEKFLDKMDKKTRNNLLKNLKLVLNYLNNKNEEIMFSYLDKDFLNQLSALRAKLGDFNNSLLINIENGLKNIKEKRFLQQINIIDDVEQMIQIFDFR